MYDLPTLDQQEQHISITAKAHKEKVKIDIQTNWTGEDVMKVIACKTEIPINTMKLIHKGKVLDSDSLKVSLKNRAVYQVIGEQCEDDTGVEEKDILVMMKQLGIDRNCAVKALKSHTDVLDAIMEVANR